MATPTEAEVIAGIKEQFDVDARFYDQSDLDGQFDMATHDVILPRSLLTTPPDELPQGAIYITNDPDAPGDVAAMIEDLVGRRLLEAGFGADENGKKFYIFIPAQVQT